jgi:hypothetical protein
VIETRGRVEHGDRRAVEPAHRRRVTHELVIAATEVRVAVYLGRPIRDRRGADRVGAARRLAPVRAFDQPHALRDLGELTAAARAHDDAIGIGEQQQEVVLGHRRRRAIEHRIAERAHELDRLGVQAQRFAAQ